MSMAQGKANFLDLLADNESKVIALTGKWGTGKSHMWREVQKASTDPAIKGALYVSLFGVATIVDLKLRLAQSAMPLGEMKGPRMDAAIAAIRGAKQLAKSFFSGVSAIDEWALLAVPALVRKKFIVLDDIERKHAKLAIDEVLGFIDDFTQTYECRILLILNIDQLSDKGEWEKFREKVIDQELRLETSVAEAFDIAIRLSPSELSQRIQPAVQACGLTNIRIIRKVIRAVNRILASRLPLPIEVLDRLIPSSVLLAAIHYRGIERGPSVEFVLTLESSFAASFALQERKKRGQEESEEDKLHARWSLLMQKLGILGTDDYEKLVADYLNSGLFDRSKVDLIIDRYLKEARFAGAQARVRAFFQTSIWHPDKTEQQVVESARDLLPDIGFLDPYTVTSLHDDVHAVEGGQALAQEMIDIWIGRLRERSSQPGADPQQLVLDNFFNRPIHPEIAGAFEQARLRIVKPRSLLDVCLYLATSGGWNPSEEAVMQAASVDDFIHTILGNSGDTLKTFMLKNMDIYANRGTYARHFGSAPANFLEACKRIRADRPNTRWVRLIKSLFDDSRLGLDLEPTPPEAAVEQTA